MEGPDAEVPRAKSATLTVAPYARHKHERLLRCIFIHLDGGDYQKRLARRYCAPNAPPGRYFAGTRQMSTGLESGHPFLIGWPRSYFYPALRREA
jgi:hypothetical protein